MIDDELLKILVCPEDKTPVRPATAEEIGALNQRIETGALKNRSGQAVTEALTEGLVREDGRYLYPIRDDIPVMLVDEAIPLS
jgi:uncharacterized protein YbaR (Trm112 family)